LGRVFDTEFKINTKDTTDTKDRQGLSGEGKEEHEG